MRSPVSPCFRTSHAAAVAVMLLTLTATSIPASADAPPAARLARGRMLVASAALPDPSFHHAVILLLEYETSGALGVILNRATDVKLDTVLPEVTELKGRSDTIFLGGPVARDRMIVLVRAAKAPASSAPVLDGLFITASFDVLRELARGSRDATPFRAFAGYAGWGPGQLDAEVGRGDWDVVPGDVAKVLTREPAQLWEQLHERAKGEWVKASPPSPAADVAPIVAQRSIGGVALPPPARNACRASTLAFTS
jgi:putative transcriptional regulator